jgi:hypothetical protein
MNKKYNDKEMHSVNLHCDENTSLASDLEYFWRKKMDEAQVINEATDMLKQGKSLSGTPYEAFLRAFLPTEISSKIK